MKPAASERNFTPTFTGLLGIRERRGVLEALQIEKLDWGVVEDGVTLTLQLLVAGVCSESTTSAV